MPAAHVEVYHRKVARNVDLSFYERNLVEPTWTTVVVSIELPRGVGDRRRGPKCAPALAPGLRTVEGAMTELTNRALVGDSLSATSLVGVT